MSLAIQAGVARKAVIGQASRVAEGCRWLAIRAVWWHVWLTVIRHPWTSNETYKDEISTLGVLGQRHHG
jgi:hypothetical protein